MKGDHNIFSNYYRVLDVFYDSQVTINGSTFCAVTQLEIAKILGHNRMTINPIVKNFKKMVFLLKLLLKQNNTN